MDTENGVYVARLAHAQSAGQTPLFRHAQSRQKSALQACSTACHAHRGHGKKPRSALRRAGDDEACWIEFSSVQANGSGPKAKLTVWRVNGDGFKWKETNWLKVGDNLAEKSGNISYRDYTIERIWKSLHGQKYHLKFSNGVELILKERNGDISGLFRQQLQWLIRRHFQKKPVLAAQGIKCLSLIFIDKVDNYVRDEGIIKLLFREEYAARSPRESSAPIPLPARSSRVPGLLLRQDRR